MSRKDFLAKLSNNTLLGAEGYVYELERRGYIKAGPYVPEVVLDYPNALRELHREFLRSGADVMVALTYYAHRDKLKVVGREDELEKMNKKALQIAKEIANEGDAFVAGNICNTWAYDPDNKEASSKKVSSMYKEQVGWANDAGVDLIIGETIEYVGEALLALEAIKEYNLPAVITFAPTDEQTRDGYTWVEACKILEKEGADVVGLNCIQGPFTMMPILEKIRESVECFVAAQPVPYRTTNKHKHFQYQPKESGDGFVEPYELDPYLLSRNEMAKFAKQAKDVGIDFIGICCGAGPHHVRAMAEAIGKTTKASKYSPDLNKHAQLGDEKSVSNHVKSFIEKKK